MEGGGTTVRNIAENSIGTGRHGDITSFSATHAWIEDEVGWGVQNSSGSGNGKRLGLPDNSICENADFPTAFSFFCLIDTPAFPGSDTNTPYLMDFDGDMTFLVLQNTQEFQWSQSGTTTSTVTVSVGAWDRMMALCATIDGALDYAMYVDGDQLASGTWVGTPTVNGPDRSIGGHDTSNRDLIGTFFDVRFWNRALTEQEVTDLHEDIWGLYRSKTFISLAVQDPVAELSGTATLTVTPDADATLFSNLGGTSTVTFTPDADLTLVTLSELEGTATLTVTPNAELTTIASVAGTAAITVTPDANLTRLALMGGTVAVSVTAQTADLQNVVNLEGSDTLTVDANADLFIETRLSGSVSLDVTPDADLTGTASLGGTATMSISATGAMLGNTDMAGTGAITLTPSGDVTGATDIGGTATLSLDTSADLFLTDNLTGTVGVSVTPQADLELDTNLSGTATATITPSADLELIVSMTATDTITVTPDADLTLVVELSGTDTITLTPTADLVGRARLEGSDTITVTPQADLMAAAHLGGSTTITITPQADLNRVAPMSGTGTISIAATADVELDTNLTATASITVTPQADLMSEVSIAGTVTMTITPSAAMLAAADLAGSVLVLVDADANLLGRSDLSGSGMFQISANANLRTAVEDDPSRDAVRLVQQRFKAQIDDVLTNVAVQYDNAPPIRPGYAPHIFFHVRPTGVAVLETTRGLPTLSSVQGVASSRVRVPARDGRGSAISIVDDIAAAFTGVVASGVSYSTPSVISAGRSGGFYSIDIDVPFRFDF